MPSWTAEARRFLEAHRVGHLATAGLDGLPLVMPVCYALDDDGLVFIADAKPKRGPARAILRLRHITENPQAAIVVDDWDEDWRRLAWTSVRGPARIVTDPAAHADAVRRLRARHDQYIAMALDDPAKHPVVHIARRIVRMWRADAS